MRPILITGGTGFVGSHLLAFLKPLANKIVVASSATPEAARDAAVTYLALDVRDSDAVDALMRDLCPGEIYHLAGITSVEASWTQPRLTFDVNVVGTYNIFSSAMALASPPRILNVSTSQVYARSPAQLNESNLVAPGNPYAATKAMAELLTTQFASPVNIVTVRAFNHSGPGQSPNFVLSCIAKQFAEIKLGLRQPELALGNVHIKRDFTDVRDVVRAYKLLVEKGRPGEIYNLCSGRTVGLREVIRIFCELLGVEVAIKVDETKVRSNDLDVIWGDASKLTRETGWLPSIPLVDTLRDMLADWAQKLDTVQSAKS